MPPAAIDALVRVSMLNRTASDIHTIVSRIKLGPMEIYWSAHLRWHGR
jgi:hypothetical protein